MYKFVDGIPIYLQIVKEIKGAMISGKLKGGDKLPSVREIAEQYQVNPNTVQRVFMELDKQGLTYSERGIGTFVKREPGLLEDLKSEEAAKVIENFIEEIQKLGYSKNDMLKALDNAWPKGGEQHD
ncbi:HTH-type transcriptional repressor YtrA [Sporotomaculum syntrophicum]|uniref:HTH-type transcriptional repressor YtrA n=1 Tax=Sporotomaculum syntrophicum TaxID=182264 RepID=A0A9D3AV82_9FIRM|nr:GntR family transcriptional regulator [Sporotomaculum syntrophicum]KAF1083755.1 HTH-type transcriptional repressor YtrA [Sporotomaculum syntrophicum]